MITDGGALKFRKEAPSNFIFTGNSGTHSYQKGRSKMIRINQLQYAHDSWRPSSLEQWQISLLYFSLDEEFCFLL